MSKFERQPPRCREFREFVRPPRMPNKVRGTGVKELALQFSGLKREVQTQEDRSTISANASLLLVCIDIQSELKAKGTHTEHNNGAVVSRQELYTTDLFVNLNTGKILDFDHNEVDLEVAYGEETARLELEVLVDHKEFVRAEPGYQQYQFSIHCPENPDTGRPFPLDTLLDERAIKVILATEQLCNNPAK
jgi:hypothetical protein